MLKTMRSRESRHQRGYNLVEVLIAMGLLSTVLLTIITLFVIGRQNVYSGRQLTTAVALSTRIMEDISATGAKDLYTKFNIVDATATNVTQKVPPLDLAALPIMPESTYANSIMRSTTSIAVAGTGCTGTTLITFNNDPAKYLQKWYCQLFDGGTVPKLVNPSISLVFTPRLPDPSAAALTVGPSGSATVLRVRAIIRWKEAARNRQVIVDTTRFRRPNLP